MSELKSTKKTGKWKTSKEAPKKEELGNRNGERTQEPKREEDKKQEDSTIPEDACEEKAVEFKKVNNDQEVAHKETENDIKTAKIDPKPI